MVTCLDCILHMTQQLSFTTVKGAYGDRLVLCISMLQPDLITATLAPHVMINELCVAVI